MKRKGQRTFNNENVHRIKMLSLTLYPLYSPWLLDIFHQRGKVIITYAYRLCWFELLYECYDSIDSYRIFKSSQKFQNGNSGSIITR